MTTVIDYYYFYAVLPLNNIIVQCKRHNNCAVDCSPLVPPTHPNMVSSGFKPNGETQDAADHRTSLQALKRVFRYPLGDIITHRINSQGVERHTAGSAWSERATPVWRAIANSTCPRHSSQRYTQGWVVPSASLILGSIWTPFTSLPGKDESAQRAWGRERERGEIETLWLLIRSWRSPLVLQESHSVRSLRAPRYGVRRCHWW